MKKASLFLLAIIITLVLLPACGGSKNNTPANPQGGGNQTSEVDTGPVTYNIGGSYSVTIPSDLNADVSDKSVSFDTGTWSMFFSTNSSPTLEEAMSFFAGYEKEPVKYGFADGFRILGDISNTTQGKFEFFFETLGPAGTPIGQFGLMKYHGEDDFADFLESPVVKGILDSISAPE